MRAEVIFKDLDTGKQITVTATEDEHNPDDVTFKFDFGEEGLSSHGDGLHAGLAAMFFEALGVENN